MRITLSERLLTEQIKQLENLDPAINIDEIAHNMTRYFRRLAEHVQHYGVTLLGEGFQSSGAVATMCAVLNPSHLEDDVVTRLNGLRMLNPLSVSVEPGDLPAFVTDPIARIALEDGWSSYGHELQRVSVSQIRATIERIAAKVLFAPHTAPRNDVEALEQEQGYELFLARAGKRDPLAKHAAVEEYNRAEVARVHAAQQKAVDDFWNRGE
jgi:hypothetical protein